MREYARQRGLRRVMIRVPLLTPRSSSLWLALVTPVYARIGRRLIGSIRHATIVRDERASRVFSVVPRDLRITIAGAGAAGSMQTGSGRCGGFWTGSSGDLE